METIFEYLFYWNKKAYSEVKQNQKLSLLSSATSLNFPRWDNLRNACMYNLD